MPTLYLHPDTGELLEDPVAWATPVPDVDVGVEAPLIVRCQLHGRYELHDRVVGALHHERSGKTILDLGRCLLAAAARSCQRYRVRSSQFANVYRQRLAAFPLPHQPLASYLLVADLIAQCAPHADALHALTELPIPDLPQGVDAVGRHAALDPATSAVLLFTPPGTAPSQWVSLPRDRQWLLAPCRDHGWDLLGSLAPLDGRTTAIMADYAHVLVAQGVTSCDDLRARMELLRTEGLLGELPTPARAPASPLDALRYYQTVASDLLRITRDTAWVVSELLDRIARQKA